MKTIGAHRGYLIENALLVGTVGSKAHGLNLEGSDDHDLMGIFIEPPEFLIGLEGLETVVRRTKPEGERSEHGDFDVVMHGLRKWCRLAVNGNPTVLMMMFLPPTSLTVCRKRGVALQQMHRAFASKRAVRAFLGYMIAQKERLVGQRGQMRVTRQDLIDKFGYDTKYAMHVLRLAKQGFEFCTTGRMTLPMPEPDRLEVMRVRRGEFTLDDTLGLIRNAELRLEEAYKSCTLPDQADRVAINEFMVQTYRSWWRNFGWNYDMRAKREPGDILPWLAQ